MYRIQMGRVDLWSPTCPARTGIGGRAHLAVELSDKKGHVFNVPAHGIPSTPGERVDVATVNGVPVWDQGRNDWARERTDVSQTQWEQLAEAASPIQEEADAEVVGPDAQSVIDEIETDARQRVEAAEAQAKATADAAQAAQLQADEEMAALRARIAELEAVAMHVDEGSEPAEAGGADAPDSPSDDAPEA